MGKEGWGLGGEQTQLQQTLLRSVEGFCLFLFLMRNLKSGFLCKISVVLDLGR